MPSSISLFPTSIWRPAKPALTDIQLWMWMWARPIGISQNFTGHSAFLVMLEGTVPHHFSGHDSSQMVKLCFSPVPRKNLNLVAP